MYLKQQHWDRYSLPEMNSHTTIFDNAGQRKHKAYWIRTTACCWQYRPACLCDRPPVGLPRGFHPRINNYKFKPDLNRTEVANEFTVSTSFLAHSQNCKKRLFASSCWSVRPSARVNSPPPDGFSLHLIFEYPSKICVEDRSFIKIWQE